MKKKLEGIAHIVIQETITTIFSFSDLLNFVTYKQAVGDYPRPSRFQRHHPADYEEQSQRTGHQHSMHAHCRCSRLIFWQYFNSLV